MLPDRIIGKLMSSRSEIVERLKSAGVVCDACAGPRRSELVDDSRIDVMASDMPFFGQSVAAVKIVRCAGAGCSRIWDPLRLTWTDPPEPLEQRV